jgi:hypothetical protein
MEWAKVRWGESPRLLLQVAREISKELGHYEMICPLHLLLGMLINVRPVSLAVPQPEWSDVQTAMREFAPPWDDGLVVLSPGGQTPTTRRVLEQAARRALDAGESVEVEHLWAALIAVESGLVGAVLSRLRLEQEPSIVEPVAPADRPRD